MSKDVIVCRAREGKRYRGTELVDYPSTTPVSNVPHLPGIEEGLVSSSANQSSPSDQPHASKPVGSNEPLIVPWVPTRRRSVCVTDILVISVRSLKYRFSLSIEGT